MEVELKLELELEPRAQVGAQSGELEKGKLGKLRLKFKLTCPLVLALKQKKLKT